MNVIHTEWGYFYDTNDAIIHRLKEGAFWDVFLKDIYDKHLNRNCIVIDVGAHVGLHSIYLSKLCNRSRQRKI